VPEDIFIGRSRVSAEAVVHRAIVTWNRLEGRPRREDFDRSLRVEVRDALWMLCRQWQVGEFLAGDTGSATKAKVQIRAARINRYAARDCDAVGHDDSLPLETRVEREAIYLDLITRARMGRHWLRLLAPVGDYRAAYLDKYGFVAPAAGSEDLARLRSDYAAWQTFRALKDRAVDGGRLLQAMLSPDDDHRAWLTGMIGDVTEVEHVLKVAKAFQEWFHRVYSQPGDTDDSAWVASHLEYQFACAAPADQAGDAQTVFRTDQYHHGHLDWYSFDIDDNPEAKLSDRQDAAVRSSSLAVEEPTSFIPAPVEFGGMPSVRWWEFEDRRTDLGNISPSTSELATLMLADFGLIYGNDWSVVPCDLRVGSLSEVMGIVITDVFGVRTLIRAATSLSGGDTEPWNMYGMSTKSGGIDTRVFLPPATPKILEGKPLERVALTRDEMANLVWGIEQTFPGLAGGASDGYEAASDLERYLMDPADSSPPQNPVETGAEIRYRLGSRTSENWIPFIPVHDPETTGGTRLQRAAMLRLIRGTAKTPVEPRGAILRSGLDGETPRSYYLCEEEVPRAGAIVMRSYQRTRWWDGKTYTWLGRRKVTGRGQGHCGMEYDLIMPLGDQGEEQ
jgi:hypothetical protein